MQLRECQSATSGAAKYYVTWSKLQKEKLSSQRFYSYNYLELATDPVWHHSRIGEKLKWLNGIAVLWEGKVLVGDLEI